MLVGDTGIERVTSSVSGIRTGFAEAALDDVQVLTLLNCPDGWWRVWGISRNYIPSAKRVIHRVAD